MEEEQERRNVGEIELEGGQPSRNSGHTGLEPEEHRIDIVEISHRDWIESLKRAGESTLFQSQWPRMPKVPQMLRETQDFKKFYEVNFNRSLPPWQAPPSPSGNDQASMCPKLPG